MLNPRISEELAREDLDRRIEKAMHLEAQGYRPESAAYTASVTLEEVEDYRRAAKRRRMERRAERQLKKDERTDRRQESRKP
jgi:hypothetical protein